MRNTLLPRLLLAFALTLCAAAPMLLASGCGDDDNTVDASVDHGVDLAQDLAKHD